MTQGHRRYLAVALIVAALAIVVLTRSREDQRDPATAGRAAAPGAPAASRSTDPVAGLKLDQLRAAHDKLPAAERDLFRFRPKATVAPTGPQRPTPVPPQVAGPPAPPGPPPLPPIPLKIIGMVETPREAGRVAVVADARGNVFYGKEGDIIDGRYRVLKISPETAELAYLDGRGRQVLRLSAP